MDLGDLQLIAGFLARRDVPALDPTRPVDVLVLCGSAVLPSVEVAATAFHDGAVGRILVSGGTGHSTEHLHAAVRAHPTYDVVVEGRSEAAVLAEILERHLGVPASALTTEEESTNCGENGAHSVRMLAAWPDVASVVVVQDPTMQRRTHAVFDRVLSERALAHGPEVRLTSFAPFLPRVAADAVGDGSGTPVWTRERFTSLALGEVRRLRDDEDGYGPRGTGFIDHVDVPDDVLAAYERLRVEHPGVVRPAWGSAAQ